MGPDPAAESDPGCRSRSTGQQTDHQPGWQLSNEITGSEREADPTIAEPKPPGPGPSLEIGAEELPQLTEERWGGGRVETMRPVVDPLPGDLEAPRHAADSRSRFENGAAKAALRCPQGGHEPGWPCPEHEHVGRLTHGVGLAAVGGRL